MSDPHRLIRMDRPNLNDLPARRDALPGYEILTYSDDLFEEWLLLLHDAFPDMPEEFEPAGWRKKIVERRGFQPEGTFFIRHTESGRVAGGAFCTLDNPDETEIARVDWVAALEEHRGKGLGRLAVELVLHYMADRGFVRAMLDTCPPLLPAINLYLSLGFRPTPKNPEDEEIWQSICHELESRGKS